MAGTAAARLVWICPLPNGHLQATGRDARGRKQYRYHPEWRRIRDSDKFDRLADFGAALPDLRAEVEKRKELAPDRLRGEVPNIRAAMLPKHATYIDPAPKADGGFQAQVGQVYKELTGKDLVSSTALDEARRRHERHHALGRAE